MDRREDELGEGRVDRLAPLLRHPELAAEERLRSGRAQADEDARLDDLELGVEPRPARRHLSPRRLLMDAPLAARLPLEVLDGVRHVHRSAVDPDFRERLVEHPAGGADERPALLVLLVARLLADEHRVGIARPLAEDGLRPGAPELASAADGGCVLERPEVQAIGQVCGCGHAGPVPVPRDLRHACGSGVDALVLAGFDEPREAIDQVPHVDVARVQRR